MRLRSFVLNGVLSLGVFVLCLLAAEGLWRLFVSKGDVSRVYHPQMGRVNPASKEWTIRTPEYKTAMRTNSHGFRGPEFPNTRRAEEVRILFIGDSFVEAKQVPEEERFVEQTGKQLEDSWGKPVVVRALGVGGAEPSRELLFYRTLGREFHPQIVVQVLFPENDAQPWEGPYTLVRDTSGTIDVAEVHVDAAPPCPWKCKILQKSELAVQLYRFLRSLQDSQSSVDVAVQLGDFYWYTKEGQQVLANEHRYEVLAAFASTLKQEVERNGGEYRAVVLPGAFAVHENLAEEVRSRFSNIPATDWQPLAPTQAAVAALRARGIEPLDLTPTFLAEAAAHSGAYLYYPLDPHLNPAGHRLVTDSLTTHILGKSL